MMPGRRAFALTALGALILAAVYFAVDPASPWMPKCLFHSFTGLQCPGCGSQRMLHALLHGDFKAAWHFNAFLICFTPVVALLALSEIFPLRFPRLFRALHSPIAIILISLSIVLWTIGRNIFQILP